jgi:cyclopropane-fatty-acyl-phospholipid synthase
VSVDVDELARRGNSLVFGHNRRRLLAVHDGDYLTPGPVAIRQKLESLLREQDIALPGGRVVLVTMPRLLGYVFNPVSFYFCHDESGELQVAVAEVNNTFGERHWYLLTDPVIDEAKAIHFRSEKVFHVSPFFDRRGHYEFTFQRSGSSYSVWIKLLQGAKVAFAASLRGDGRPLTDATCLRLVCRQPLTLFLTMPRILWQAALLYYRKRLPVYSKPDPASPLTTLRSRPTLFERSCLAIVCRLLTGIATGHLVLRLPDGTRKDFGFVDAAEPVEIRVRRWCFFSKVVLHDDVGFGEAYTAGDWECDDLTGLLRLLLENQDSLARAAPRFAGIGRIFNRLTHRRRRNSEEGSRENIPAHYDLGNRLFESFLDRSMTYSCAYFEHPDQTLEEAQRAKIHAMIAKANITATDHVLEIGCGWGAFAIEAVRRTGCRVTGITLSEQQLQWAQERVREAGLEDRITLRLCDYRKIEGEFDKIVSIEMLEAVGHEHFEIFFDACDRLLKPEGLIAVQFISIPDDRYDAYRKGCDWIQKHIFPGGHLPSLAAITTAASRRSRLVVNQLENIGVHYARTLQEWRSRLLDQWHTLEPLGLSESFRRKWEYYFCYCEAAFANHYLGTLQLVMSRSGERGLPQ